MIRISLIFNPLVSMPQQYSCRKIYMLAFCIFYVFRFLLLYLRLCAAICSIAWFAIECYLFK